MTPRITTLTTILLATDGSPDADLAARAALDLAQKFGATLHVVHAWQVPTTATHYGAYPGLPPESLNWFYEFGEEDARRVLAGQVARLQSTAGVTVVPHLSYGRPSDEIVTLAGTLGAGLLAIGSRGLGAVGRLVLGSVSEGVMHHAPCPVLVLRGGAAQWPPARVVIGDDGSATAADAAALAVLLAAALGARALLVRGHHDLPAIVTVDAEFRAADRQRAEADLRAHAQALGARSTVQPAVLVTSDDPVAALLAAAEEADGPVLLVVGSRGHGLLQRLRLGSASTKLLHAAKGPVLIVPPRADPALAAP